MIRGMINQLSNIPILRRNPTSRWVDFKQPINQMGAPEIYKWLDEVAEKSPQQQLKVTRQ